MLVQIDSAGTEDYHVGEAPGKRENAWQVLMLPLLNRSPFPDTRTVKHARRRGYDLSQLRARQLEVGSTFSTSAQASI